MDILDDMGVNYQQQFFFFSKVNYSFKASRPLWNNEFEALEFIQRLGENDPVNAIHPLSHLNHKQHFETQLYIWLIRSNFQPRQQLV